MYLHIGQNEILPDRRVIGIFDLDKCSYGKRTREYLAAAEKEGGAGCVRRDPQVLRGV